MTSTLAICPISVLRNEPAVLMCRSMLNFTASALSGSPSWNFTPGRSLMTIDLLVGRPLVAHGELRDDLEVRGDVEELVAQRRRTRAGRRSARLMVGSSASGSSLSPMRSTLCAAAGAGDQQRERKREGDQAREARG